MKLLWIPAGLSIAVVVGSMIPGPYVSVMRVARGGALLETARLDAKSTNVIERACGSCHSNETLWPWYGHVAPVSWMLRKDVFDGRSFLNFSRWSEYGVEGQNQLLNSAAEGIRGQSMPPRRYLLLHPEAQLSDPDRLELIAALQREASRVRASAPTTVTQAQTYKETHNVKEE